MRFALHQDDELVPHVERVRQRFTNWIAGQRFTPEQVSWLKMMRDHVAASLEIEFDDFDLTPFAEAGGLGRAEQVFGKELKKVVQELNEVLTPRSVEWCVSSTIRVRTISTQQRCSRPCPPGRLEQARSPSRAQIDFDSALTRVRATRKIGRGWLLRRSSVVAETRPLQ